MCSFVTYTEMHCHPYLFDSQDTESQEIDKISNNCRIMNALHECWKEIERQAGRDKC